MFLVNPEKTLTVKPEELQAPIRLYVRGHAVITIDPVTKHTNINVYPPDPKVAIDPNAVTDVIPDWFPYFHQEVRDGPYTKRA